MRFERRQPRGRGIEARARRVRSRRASSARSRSSASRSGRARGELAREPAHRPGLRFGKAPPAAAQPVREMREVLELIAHALAGMHEALRQVVEALHAVLERRA